VKVVQQMLGHASAAMTLDVYAGLFEDDLDSVAETLDSLTPQRRHKAADNVVDLDEARAKKPPSDKGERYCGPRGTRTHNLRITYLIVCRVNHGSSLSAIFPKFLRESSRPVGALLDQLLARFCGVSCA
jgi:hypothetical protein